MTRAPDRKQSSFLVRLPKADIEIIDRASALCGCSSTEFVRDAALNAAADLLFEPGLVRMRPAGFKAFVAALSCPATVVLEMAELFRRRAPWEGDGLKIKD